MIMKKLVTMLFGIPLFAGILTAQNTGVMQKSDKSLPGRYDRNSLTVVLIDKSQDYRDDLVLAIDSVKVPDKFDDNMVKVRKINYNDVQTLLSSKVTNQVVAKWFERADDGSFDIGMLQKRGLYNATDDDVLKAQATKRGNAALEDAGEKLLNNSYIMVLEYSKVMPYEVWKMSQQSATNLLGTLAGVDLGGGEIRKNGWMATLKASLYKIDWTDSVAAVFWQEMWTSRNDDAKTKNERKSKFDNFTFPVKFIMAADAFGDGSQYNADVPLLAPPVQKTREQLFVQLIETSVDNALEMIEMKYEPFRVKVPVYSTGPIKAKVGLKEGITCDKRFFVLEYELDGQGNKVANRKAVVRARKTVDNRQLATGKTDLYTSFYQSAGRKIEPGMLLQQRNDFGLGISVGYGVGEIGGIYLKGDYNVSKIIGKALKDGWSITQLKLYAALGTETKNTYKDNEVIYSPWGSIDGKDINFLRYEVGISKGWYFLRNFSFAPFVGLGMEKATYADVSDTEVNTLLVNAGATVTMNLMHFLQVFGDFNLNMTTTAMDKDSNPIKTTADEIVTYTQIFKDRMGPTIDFGIRIEL